MGILAGKRALIVGVATDRSIAWGIAQAMHAQGAELAFSYANDAFRQRLEPLAASIGSNLLMPIDVQIDDQIDAVLRVPSPNIQLPEKAMRAAMLVDSPQRRLRRGTRRPNIHVVRRGDTLYAMAQRLGTDVQTLAQANGIRAGDRLHAGQRLHFGGSSALVSEAAAGSARSIATTGAQSAAEGGRRMTYIVRRGDTLYGIARLLQVTVNELMGWNGMSGEHSLKPGQTLVAFVKTRNAG